MKCTCVNDIEKKLKEHLAKAIDGAVESVECSAIQFTLPLPGDNRMGVNIAIPFVVKADAKGYRNGKTVTVHASHCPFCGTPTLEDPPAVPAAAPGLAHPLLTQRDDTGSADALRNSMAAILAYLGLDPNSLPSGSYSEVVIGRIQDEVAGDAADLLSAAVSAKLILEKQNWLADSQDPEAVALRQLRAAINRRSVPKQAAPAAEVSSTGAAC